MCSKKKLRTETFTTLKEQVTTKEQAIYLLFLQSKIFENIYLHQAKEGKKNTSISNRGILSLSNTQFQLK